MKTRVVILALLTAAWLAACGTQPLPIPTSGAAATPTPAVTPTTPAVGPGSAIGVTRLTGDVELSQTDFLNTYFEEPFVILQDMTGFVKRDFKYIQPDNSQTLGQVTIGQDGKITYVLNLPAEPTDPLNDVDPSNSSEPGVQIWQVMFDGNFTGGPFTSKYEFSGMGWGVNYTSAKINVDDKYEVNGGKLLVWAPDDKEQFPIWFGPDGYLFTKDDPVGPLHKGYTVVDLDTNPFTFSQDADESVHVYEGDLGVHDYSKMTYADAFDALVKNASLHYPFTDLKKVDWTALHDKFAPQFKDATDKKDGKEYYQALDAFSLSIPDSHISIVGGDDFGTFAAATSGSYGFAMTKLDDGSVVASFILPGGAADKAGMKFGAAISQWNGKTVDEVADSTPIPSNWSYDIPRRLQEYRYMVITSQGSTVDLTFKNPNEAEKKVTLTAVPDNGAISRRTSFNYGKTPLALPVEYKILPSGLGYIKINAFYDDLNLSIRLWDRAIQAFNDNQIPGVIIDLRQNPGGQPLGTFFAGYFATEKKDVTKSYFYSDKYAKFMSFFPPDFYEPHDLQYKGKLAVLVAPGCASACEEMAYVFTQLPGVHFVGMYPTAGALGEVGRGQYSLPDGWTYQIPDGYDTDLNDNLIVEGTGVVPDVKVPITLDTVKSLFVGNQDVVLNAAVDTISKELPAQ